VKQMLRAAYPPPSAPRRSASLSRWRLLTWPQAAAALVLAVVAGALGWGGRAYLLPDHPAGPAASGQLASIAPARRDAKRIVLHVSTDDTGRLKEALDDAEDLLAAYQDSAQPVQIEVVANAEGLALLRADASPFRERIQALSAHHDNIAFLACNRAIEKLHLQGVEVQLLPEARTVPGALEAIVSRLQEGWVYIKV
jgi:intracellular sulfur oxidation DsrE/DsrF family protein